MSSNKTNQHKTQTESLTEKMATKTKKNSKTVNEQIAEHFAALAALYAENNTAPISEPEEVEGDEEDEGVEEVELTREQVDEATAEGIKALRALAKEVGIEETKKADILAAFDELLGDEDEDEEDEEEYDEEDEDEDEEDEEADDEEDEDEDELDRDDLEEMDLKELRKVARENGFSASDYKGMDQDALVDLILGEDEEDDEDEDEEDDEDVEELDEDALKAMTQKDLIGLAKELEIKVPASMKKQSTANKKKLVDLILDSGEED